VMTVKSEAGAGVVGETDAGIRLPSRNTRKEPMDVS